MRPFFLFSMFCFLLSCASSNQSKLFSKLNGTWLPIRQEINGMPIPQAIYGKQMLIIKDTTYSYKAESIDNGVMYCSGNKIDIYSKEGVNAGKHFKAIYKFNGDLMTICYNLKGDTFPSQFDTHGSMAKFLSEFKKQP